MLESVVANLLNKYVGKYILNIDSSNLNVSIFKGGVELTDLQLRPEALAELNLPIEVKAGYVGHLKLNIPWTNLFTADIDIAIENVYVLAGPITDRQFDPERERQLQNAVKRQLLESIENPMLLDVARKADEDPSLTEKLLQNLINRVQVSIRHIHIRYEDMVTNPDHPFACGIMLKQVLLCSTDSRWEPRGRGTTPNMLHKLLKLDDLSVYWNPYIPEQHLLRSRLNTDGWRNLLRMSIDSHSIFEEEFDFIVEPVAAQARLIVCTENGFTLPRVFADFTIEEIEVLLSRQQFLNLLTLQESFQMMRINQRYRKYHPAVPLKVSPRSWWLYAYTAVLEEIIRPFSWERIKEHRTLYKKYKTLFKKSLESGESESTRSKLWELEEQLDVTNIIIARQQARLELLAEAPDKAKKKRKSSGWFSSWFESDSDEDFEFDTESKDWMSKLTEEERQTMFKAIGYDENSNISGYPREYVAHKVQLILKSCCVSLVNYSKKILQASVTHLITTWENRPGGDAFRLSCNTESFSIEGASIEHELIPILTSDIGVYAPSVNQVFTVDFETKPLYVEADYSLNLNVQPVEIVYDEHSLSEVSAFFQVPHGNLDLRSTAVSTLQEVAKYSRAGLQHAIEQHTTVHVALNMRSPYIVIPEFGTLHRGGNVLIVDFGTLRIESELQPKDVSLEDATMSEIESRLYDQFNISVKDVKVLLADSGDDWHTAQIQPNSDFHVLPSVQLLLTFFNTVKPDYKQLPKQKFEARVPSLEVNISDKRLLLLASFLRNFPVPSSTSMATIGEDMVDGFPPLAPVFTFDSVEAQMDPDTKALREIRRLVLGRPLVNRDSLVVSPTTKDKAATNRLSTGDDQYLSSSDHSDEDLEHLGEELHIKPVDDNSAPSNTIKVLLRMSLNEFVVNMSKVMDKQVRPYLMLRVDRLRIDSAITQYGFASHATLGGIQLVDKIHVGASGEYMEVLRTEPDNNLVSIMYRKVDPECPDFAAEYGSMEHAAKIRIYSLTILLDQASLMYLHAFIQGLVSSVQNIDMKTSTSSVITTSDLSTKDRSSITERLASMSDEVDKLPPLSTKLNLTATLEDVTVRLCDSDNSLAQIQISGFESSVLVKSSHTTLRAQLRDLSIQDCSVGAIYSKILMIEDDSLFDLKCIKYTKTSAAHHDNKRSGSSVDYSVRLNVGHLQTVYLGKFYWELVRFFEPFINREMKDAATHAAVETVHKKVEDIQTQNLRISMNINLRTPTILVPRHSKSIDILMLQLGNLSIRNFFNFTNVPPDMRQEWNHIYLNLSKFQVQSVRLNLAEDVCEVLHTVLEPISFKADLRLAMKPVNSETKMDISGQLEKVKLNILQKDLQLFFGLLTENLSEGSPPSSPGLYESPTIQNLESQAAEETVSTPALASRHDSIESEQKTTTNILLRLDGLSAILFEERETEDGTSNKTSLCLFDLEKLNINAVLHSDGDLKVNFSLQSLTADDSRLDSTLAVRRILYCAKKGKTSDEFPLVSLIYKVSSDGNQKADLMVEKIRFNVHLPYIMTLVDFFMGSVDTGTLPDMPDMPVAPHPIHAPDGNAAASASTSFSVYGSLKQPEIVFFADPSSPESRVIVLYSDLAFEYRADTEEQVMWAKVSNLHLVTSHVTVTPGLTPSCSMLMAPCSLELRQTYRLDKGVRDVTASLSKVQLYLSASVMAMVWDMLNMLQLGSKQEESSPNSKSVQDVTNLWGVSSLSGDKWLRDKPDHGSMRDMLRPPETPIEVLKFDVKELCVFFEIINLDLHTPILCLRSSLEVTVKDWSKKLHLESEFHLDMLFYNERLSTWEPLIEPVMEKEGVYRPWEVMIKVMKAKSFPVMCMYEDHDLDIPDGLQSEVQEMMHRARIKSSSSETDTDSSSDMTVIRHKTLRRVRHASDRSYDSLSHHSSVQGESDSEPEGFIQNITNKLGSIFSSDSSDADISEADDADDIIDSSLEKPVFLTSRGPVDVTTGLQAADTVDAPFEQDVEDEGCDSCLYVMIDSMDRLQLNVTPQGIAVIQDVVEALTNPSSSALCSVRDKPSFEIENKLGIHTYITLHPDVKVHDDRMKNVTVYKAGDDNTVHPASYEDDIDILPDEEAICNGDNTNGLGFVRKTLANAGHTLISAGAFVFDDDDDYLSGDQLNTHRFKLQVDGFEQLPSILHKQACRRIIPLAPRKNGTKYCVVVDIDMWHGRKVIRILSPLQLVNKMTMAVDVYCKTEDLKRFQATQGLAGTQEFSRLTTVNPHDTYTLPLFVAYHCPLYLKPADLDYELTYSAIWWQEMLQGKEKSKHFLCLSTQEEKKSFNFQVLCKEGKPLKPTQQVPKTIPYYTIALHPPVILHNYLPYDLQFSLQGTSMSSSLTHGESTPLYTVDISSTFKLLFSLTDYLGRDWTGVMEISPDLDEFKAIPMETEVDEDSANKHLSLSIHADHSAGLDLHIYAPYWVINKTQLPLQLRGSMSDAVLECGSSFNPVLFRYKKHKRKKAKLRVYDSNWSQSFSMDTIGSSGVVICNNKERQRKYMFMVQSQMSRLKLTKIVTVLPFFLVVNQSSRSLRYMEENENSDLWLDIHKGECQPFWPMTETFNMYLKYEGSNVTSQHFPIKTPHSTVLRMDKGTAMCVEVTGGTDSPITITFYNYTSGDAPVRVENLCEDVFIKIHQKNQSQVTLLSPSQCVLYTWDEPSAERTLMWNVYGLKKPSYPAFITKDGAGEVRLRVQSLKSTGTLDVTDAPDLPESSGEDDSGDEIDGLLSGADKSLIGRTRSDKMVIYWVSFLDGLQRVLLLTQDERIASAVRRVNEGESTSFAVFLSLDGILVSVINSAYKEVALFGICSTPSIWEVEVNGRWKVLDMALAAWLEDQWQNQKLKASLQEQIEADLIKMQMSKPFMGALRRTFHPGVWVQYSASKHHTVVHGTVQRLQIDNQLTDAYFPSVLYPAPLPSYVVRKRGLKPFIEFALMRRTVPDSNVDTVRYLKVLVQEFSLRLDKGFILSLADIFANLQKNDPESWQLHSDLLLAQRSLMEAASIMVASRTQKTYFEYLHLSPLKLRVSFSLSGTPHVMNSRPSTIRSDIIDFFLTSVGATLTDITDVELRLAYFQQKGVLLSGGQLLALVQSHYMQQALQQAYVLILGLDVLGNPYGLVRDFTQGLGDFFYEPFLGSIQGSDEFAQGLARGVYSLMGNTVGGAAGSLSSMTGSIGNALAILSFDDDYQKRRRRVLQQQPQQLPASLMQACRTLVMGVGLGFTGLVLDPVKGVHEDGVEGFFKGVGKGILGLLTKPAGGVVDMVSMAFDGLRRAAEMEGGPAAKLRLTRFIDPNVGLRPYSEYRAAGQQLLLSLKKGELSQQDVYWAHAPLSKEERTDILLITDKHVLMLERCRFWGGWDVEWSIDVDAILGVPAIHDGKLIFKVKQDESGLNLFMGGEQEVSSTCADILIWIQKQIELLLSQQHQKL
ncbi:vacuolar protein sorting-associated protein 13A-like isoform X2 [Pomacea canaliculata]|uniref:vacuolar protein sorting-associated protein 13A-like isoform X2 n=1 Tax=Pomacea canaliculata TaxID=400727 RepID=UPI000D7257C8|nr:vacuolar protein sorting-associated protein 13A-like isoform X2 [Pomacea canaliculata]